jgi:HK97 gp10 family phage protein
MGANVKWYAAEVEKHVMGTAAERVEKAAILLKNAVKEELSTAYSGKASAEGEPPHKRTGRLRASINHEVDKAKATARVGTNLKYGKFLELGTRKMAARPFLTSTLQKLSDAIGRLLKGA